MDYAQLTKTRLTFLVVFSAVIGYLFGSDATRPISGVFGVVIGGLLITSASIIINQIIERDIDKLMKRTQHRPLPSGRMKIAEALLAAILFSITGVFVLWKMFNLNAAILAASSLIGYSFVYTLLKRVHTIAVFIGAIPGALPTTIGYVCATGEIDYVALLLFAIQFFWQLPHFWAIAWMQYDDYKTVGIMLLPSVGGKNKSSAFQIMIYTFILLLVSALPYYFELVGIIGTIVILTMGIIFFWQSLRLWIKCDDTSAKKLMFGSFIYLPVVQLAMLLDKIG